MNEAEDKVINVLCARTDEPAVDGSTKRIGDCGCEIWVAPGTAEAVQQTAAERPDYRVNWSCTFCAGGMSAMERAVRNGQLNGLANAYRNVCETRGKADADEMVCTVLKTRLEALVGKL